MLSVFLNDAFKSKSTVGTVIARSQFEVTGLLNFADLSEVMLSSEAESNFMPEPAVKTTSESRVMFFLKVWERAVVTFPPKLTSLSSVIAEFSLLLRMSAPNETREEPALKIIPLSRKTFPSKSCESVVVTFPLRTTSLLRFNFEQSTSPSKARGFESSFLPFSTMFPAEVIFTSPVKVLSPLRESATPAPFEIKVFPVTEIEPEISPLEPAVNSRRENLSPKFGVSRVPKSP